MELRKLEPSERKEIPREREKQLKLTGLEVGPLTKPRLTEEVTDADIIKRLAAGQSPKKIANQLGVDLKRVRELRPGAPTKFLSMFGRPDWGDLDVDDGSYTCESDLFPPMTEKQLEPPNQKT